MSDYVPHPRPDYADLRQDIGRLTGERDRAIAELAALRAEVERLQVAIIQGIQIASSPQPIAMHPSAVASLRLIALQHIEAALAPVPK